MSPPLGALSHTTLFISFLVNPQTPYCNASPVRGLPWSPLCYITSVRQTVCHIGWKDESVRSCFNNIGLTLGKTCVILYYRSVLWGCKDRIQKFRDHICEYISEDTEDSTERGWKNPLEPVLALRRMWILSSKSHDCISKGRWFIWEIKGLDRKSVSLSKQGYCSLGASKCLPSVNYLHRQIQVDLYPF